jgi:hypothetical protein
MGRPAYRAAVTAWEAWMRRLVCLITVLAAAVPPAIGQTTAGYPHGFLFGAWVGGIFPAPTTLNARECLANPTMLFTKDVVFRADPIDATYSQSLVETVRDTGNGVEFRLVQAGPTRPSSGVPFGLGQGFAFGSAGFGCGHPTVLRVQRRGEHEISFPGCTEFPYPLVRCPAN